MSTPLTATDRIEISYIVDGFTHKFRSYVKQSGLVGGVPQVLQRDGTTTSYWGIAAQAAWDAIRTVLNMAIAPASAVMENLVGIEWVVVDSLLLSGGGLSGNPSILGNQVTLVLRDTAAHKIRVQVMENTLGRAGHSLDGSSNAPDGITMVNKFIGAGVGLHIFDFQKSRGDRYVAASGASSGFTVDNNDKLMRRRGLA